MGKTLSKEETKDIVRNNFPLEKFAFTDLVLDSCLKEFSGLQSNVVFKERCVFLFKNFPTKMGEFVNQAKALTVFPNAVGISAFFILWMIEANLASTGDNFSSTLNSMFAREKGNEVFNIARAYYKRFTMFVHDSTKLLDETKIYERQLGDQLTRVRNSLLDGNMSTALFKVWVNGAAFHVQMLIHLIRLEGGDRLPVRAVIGHYQRELLELVDEFQRFKVKQFKIEQRSDYNAPFASTYFLTVTDRESDQQMSYIRGTYNENRTHVTSEIWSELLFEQDKHIPRLLDFFSEIQQNVDGLIDLNEHHEFAFDEN